LIFTIAAVARAQQSDPPKGTFNGIPCLKTTDIKPMADLTAQYKPGSANFPCNMGDPIPLGPVPKGCAKLEVIIARGTSEPGALGSMVGDPLIARMKRDYPKVDLRGYPVQYPADGFGLTNLFPKAGAPKGDVPQPKAPSPAEIAAHSAIGPNDIVSRIESQTKECPGTKFALVGYSQGGMVVIRAATTLKSKPELSQNVIAVVLYGAGDGKPVALSQSIVLANCARGDMACPEGGNNKATALGHVSYNDLDSKWHDRSGQFIISAFNGKPLGPKVAKTATEALV